MFLKNDRKKSLRLHWPVCYQINNPKEKHQCGKNNNSHDDFSVVFGEFPSGFFFYFEVFHPKKRKNKKEKKGKEIILRILSRGGRWFDQKIDRNPY